jgi:uncharacterized protein
MTAQRSALITGASTGLGALYADRLARRGYDVILVARDAARLSAVASDISRRTGRAATVTAADLTDDANLATIERRLRTDAAIDVLVNNAGTGLNGSVAETDAGALERMVRLNVLAPTRLAAAIVPGFVGRGRGTLINIASAVAVSPEPLNGAYSGTKAYLLNLSLKLQQELAGTGVRVQVVLPGAIRTDLWGKAGIDLDTAVPRHMVMDAADLVDAALAGLDIGETVTMPSLRDVADWQAYDAARKKLASGLSRDTPAPRYRPATPNAAGA